MTSTPFELRSLQDLEEIRALKKAYCATADLCASPDGSRFGADMAALFIEEGVWEAPEAYGGRHAGRAAIAQFFGALGQSAIWASHMVLNDRITITGDSATGIWKNIVPVTYLVAGKATAFTIYGGYREEYVRVGGRWMYRRLNAIVDRGVCHEQGWV